MYEQSCAGVFDGNLLVYSAHASRAPHCSVRLYFCAQGHIRLVLTSRRSMKLELRARMSAGLNLATFPPKKVNLFKLI